MKKIFFITLTTSFAVFCRGEVNLSTKASCNSIIWLNQSSTQCFMSTSSEKHIYFNSNVLNGINESSDAISSTHLLNGNHLFSELTFKPKRTFLKTGELTTKSDHSIFLEIGGSSPFFSVNYEYNIATLSKGSIVSSIGIHHPAGISIEDRGVIQSNGTIKRKRVLTDVIIPFRLSWISHNGRKHHAEIGVGLTYYTIPFVVRSYDMVKPIYFGKNRGNRGIFFIPTTGYRFTASNGTIVRLTLTPYINQYTDPIVQLYGGVSFGYQFRKKT